VLRKALSATRLILVRPQRAWLMARIAGWTLILSYAVRFRSLPAALRMLSVQDRTRNVAGKVDPTEIATAVDAVLGMNVAMFRQSCWRRAILISHFLGQEGLATTVVFGLRVNPGGEIQGHAWLETEGRVLLEPEQPNYRVTYKFPSGEVCTVDLEQIAGDKSTIDCRTGAQTGVTAIDLR
jgi:hypothetical protein